MVTYCLFCETGKTEYVARAAMQVFPCRAISPKQIQHTWTRGVVDDRVHDLLPGYVFLYFEEPIRFYWELRKVDRIIRCLRNTDQSYELHGSDEKFALMLLQKDGVLGKTQVTETDGRFTISDESFQGVNVQILKVDRRYRRMKIEILVAGNKVHTWVEYEIVPQMPE